MSLQKSKPTFFFEILLVKLILHFAALEFPILCQYHIIVIIRLLFYSSLLSLLVSSLYLFSLLSLFSICLALILFVYLKPFLSYGTAVSVVNR